MDEKKLKLWLSFGKFFLSTFIIGLITVIVNYQIQNREVDLKNKEILLKDKEAEFSEMERLGEFVTHALSENIAVRRRFSQYFATVTRSPELRERWKEYALLVENEYRETESRKTELEELKIKLQNAMKSGESVSDELEKVKTELEKTKAELEVKPEKNLKGNFIIKLSNRISTEDIFDVNRWIEPIDLDVLNTYSDLSRNILDPLIRYFKTFPEIVKKFPTPTFANDMTINLTFGIPNVNSNELICWLKNNCNFDRIVNPAYLFSMTLPVFDVETAKITIYYRKINNRKIIDEEVKCPQ